MAKQTINVGITANDRRGDPLRVAFTKINENFDEVYDIIPTQLSDLANDEGFITANSLPTQLSDLTNDTGYITANSLPTQLSDLTNDEGFITNETTHMTLTQRYQFGEPVFFSNQSDVSLADEIGPGLIIARNPGGGGIYNAAVESGYDQTSRISPEGTLWNYEGNGFGNLDTIKNRYYTTFSEALKHQVGRNIIGSDLVMHDTINDKYYKFEFSHWGIQASGTFAYTRTEIIPVSVGVEFPDGTYQPTAWTGFLDRYNKIHVGPFSGHELASHETGSVIYFFNTHVTLPNNIENDCVIGSFYTLVVGNEAASLRVKKYSNANLIPEIESVITPITNVGPFNDTEYPLEPYSIAHLIKIERNKWSLVPAGYQTSIVGEVTATTLSANSVTSDLIPEDDATYDLGSPTKQWRSLYVSANTIFIGGTPLSVDNEGNLTVSGSPVVGTGSTSVPYLELTNRAFTFLTPELDEEVSFTKVDGDSGNTAIDFIDDGLSITRGNQAGLYNVETEQSYDDGSPEGTLWNSSGWGDLRDFRNREYVPFRESLNNRVGENILDAELVMWDTINDNYYTFKFSSWTQGGNGGGFSYVRRRIIDLNFFRKVDYGSEVDIFVDDDPEGSGIAITRGNNQGIYNPFRESGWDSNVSPEGTLWNADGWSNLKNIEGRNYVNFYDAVDGDLGDNVPNRELIMFIPDTNQYFAIKFLSWTQNNNGGGISYLRYEIDLSQLDEGITFADGSVQKTAYVETNVISTAPNKRRIETQDGFVRAQLTELVTGDTFESTIYQTAANTTFIQVIETEELILIRDAQDEIQISFDEETWINARFTGFSSIPVRRFFIETEDNVRLDVTEGQTIYARSRSGAEPVRWFRAEGDDFRGAIIDFHAYASQSGTIVGTIKIIRDSGEGNIFHTEVKSGNTSNLEKLDLWLRRGNERNIWVRRTDGQAETVSIHWHGKFFYGTEYWD